MELKSLSRERIQGGEIQGPECYNRMTCHQIEVRTEKHTQKAKVSIGQHSGP